MTTPLRSQALHQELRQSYQFAIDQGLKTLKIQFLRRLHQNPFASGLRRIEIHQITGILSPPWNKKQRIALAKAHGAQPHQLHQIRKEVQFLLQGQTDQLLRLRSLHEITQRAKGPFFETEAYFHYLNWLEEGNFPVSSQETALWPVAVSPLEWLAGFPKLERLFALLLQEELIGSQLNQTEFLAHFRSYQAPAPLIPWRASNTLLLYFFEQLIRYHFLPEHLVPYLPSLLPRHFQDRKGQTLKSKSLSVLRSKSFKPPRDSERIDLVMEALLKS